jgi:hypothetical protein
MLGLFFQFLFNLPSKLYYVISALLILAGIGSFYVVREDDAMRSAALKHKPPAVVDIDQFRLDSYKADYDEIVIRGQLNPLGIIEQVETKNSKETKRVLYLPLFPISEVSPNSYAKAVIVIEGTVTNDRLRSLEVGAGNFGPIIQVNGRVERNGSGDQDASKALVTTTRLVPNFAVIKPFKNGRAVDLAPSHNGPIGVLISFLVFAVLIALYGVHRKKTEGGYEDTETGYQP